MHRASRRLTFLVVFAFACCAGAARADNARHALWQVKGAHNVVYLLGSMHMLPATEQLPAVVDRAYAAAEHLVMEIDMDDLDPIAVSATTMQLGLLPEGQTLQAMLGAENAAELAVGAQKLGVDASMLARFRPWLAAITLSQFALLKKGLTPQDGVEMRFVKRATQDGKDIVGLETLEEQLGFFAQLPDAEQTDYLMHSLRESDQADDEIERMLQAWRIGDDKSLAKMLDKDFAKFPGLFRTLTVDRNRRWIGQLENLLRQEDDYLVIVGAIHLVGKHGVVDLLEQRGYKVLQQ